MNYYKVLRRLDLKPWELRCSVPKNCKTMNIQIYFSHDDAEEDAVEFSIQAWSSAELARLFKHFCEENGFKNVLIDNVYITQAAETWRELV